MSAFWKRLTYLLTLAVISYVVTVAIDAYKHATAETRLFHDVGDATYAMLNPDNLENGGTGFLVRGYSGTTYILTNKHVCGLAKNNQLVAYSVYNEQPVSLIDMDKDADLCLMYPPKKIFAKPLRTAWDALYGTQIYLIGHPLLHPMTVKTGFLVGKSTIQINTCHSMIEVMVRGPACMQSFRAQVATVDSRGGNSGSAVTNVNGNLVGVLFAGDDNGLSALVPLEDIKRYLSKF